LLQFSTRVLVIGVTLSYLVAASQALIGCEAAKKMLGPKPPPEPLLLEPDNTTTSTGLMAGEVEVGDVQAGFTYAKEVCANCHAIVSNETSPVPKATSFDEIANTSEMSAKALLVWMQTRHPTMPNITLEREDLMDVIAYILSRKDKGRSDHQ
jgi:mono/diheme cytochrome c family protein